MPDRVLLDTCALVWLAADAPELTGAARQTVESAEVVYVSTISAWEVALKTRRGTLGLPLPPLEWFDGVVERHRLDTVALSPEILVTSTELPEHHRDPADRFIIASALILGAPIITTDIRFHDYAVEVLA